MSTLNFLQVSYLLFTPVNKDHETTGEQVLNTPKDAPYFFELDVKFSDTEITHVDVENRSVTITSKVMDGVVKMWECRYVLKNSSEKDAVYKNRKMRTELKRILLGDSHASRQTLYEEYMVVLIGKTGLDPEKIVDENNIALGGLLRSVDKPLDRGQAEQILSSRIKYSQNDMTVVDWEGAVIIADDDDWQSDIDLLSVGNYQLVRYRMLDHELEERLKMVYEVVEGKKKRMLTNPNKLIFDLVKQRLNLILVFEKVEQSLLLIGDWYSAQLYKIISDEFYIDDWKRTVKSKLDSLGEIQETVTQNLSFSWARVFDQLQFWGWLVLLIGYFVLFYLDIKAI